MTEKVVGSTIDVVKQVESLSYEDARAKLVDIVSRLEQGSIPLEESLHLWELGEALARHCQAYLDGVAARLHAVEAGQAAAQQGSTTQAPTAGTAATSPATGVVPTETPTANRTQAATGVAQASEPITPQFPAGTTAAQKISALREQISQVEADPATEFHEAPAQAMNTEELDTSPLVHHPEDFE